MIFKLSTLMVAIAAASSAFASISPNIIRTGAADIVQTSEPSANWVDADPAYSEWSLGTPYDCSAWQPDPSGYTADAQFTQTSNSCSIEQTRERQARQQDTYSLAYRNVGDPVIEEQILLNQSAERDYRIQYSTWAAQGEPYGCTNWSPSEDSYALGQAFIQIANDCELNQSRTRTETSQFQSSGWVQEAMRAENRTVSNQSSARDAVGTAQSPVVAASGPTTVFVSTVFSLSWTSSNQTKLWLSSDNANSGVGTTPVQVTGSSYALTPTASGTYTYTVKAENNAGQSSESTQTVTVANAPVVASLSASPISQTAGGNTTLTWSSSGADSWSINGTAVSGSSGSVSMAVGSTTGPKTYTMTASRTLNGVTKTATKDASITVTAAAPVCSFSGSANGSSPSTGYLEYADQRNGDYRYQYYYGGSLVGSVSSSGVALTQNGVKYTVGASKGQYAIQTSPSTYRIFRYFEVCRQ